MSPRREAAKGKPLAPDLLPLPPGDWYAAERVELSNEHTGYVLYDAVGAAWLMIVERKTKRVSEHRMIAAFEKLEGAYEKTTQSRLVPVKDGWELVTSVFLHDLEMDAPGAPNTTGTRTTTLRFSSGMFR